MSTLSLKAVEIAKTKIGVKEVPAGSNSGPEVDKILANVNIFSPASWCMAFVYTCFKEAAKELNVANPLFKAGGCLLQLQKSAAFVVKGDPQPGDVFILDLGHGHGHTGIVVSGPVNGVVQTIEGNSNNNGSANGEAVVNHSRTVTKVRAFLRF